jgi:hypothetical protein
MEMSKQTSDMFVKQIKHFQVNWRDSSATTWQQTDLPNTATTTRLTSLRANTTYLVTLKVFNVDPYYKPKVSRPITIKTAG